MININTNFSQLKKSYLFQDIARRINVYKDEHPEADIIRLGIGDVTLPLAPAVVEAMHKAADEMGKKETFRGYPPENGYQFLRDAIVKHYTGFHVELGNDEIFVSDGAKSDLGNIVDIFGHNEVLIPDPVYPVYNDFNVMSGNQITFLPANKENDFPLLPDMLESRSMVIYMCSPNNPTGAAYNHDQLKQWVDYANHSGSVILFDSAYEAYIHGDYPHSIYEIDGAESCAIEINSFSKAAAAFTGTRCGWTVIPKKLMVGDTSLNALWNRRQSTKFNGVSYVIQRAAEAALSDEGRAECMKSVDYYMENVRLISEVLTKNNVWFTGGISSPYIWLRCPNKMKS